MALYVYFHYGYLIGTYLLVKAQNEAQARQQLEQELSHPKYLPQDLSRVTGFQLAATDELEEHYRQLLYKANIELIHKHHGPDCHH